MYLLFAQCHCCATILHNKQLNAVAIDFRLTAKVIDKMNLVLSNESASQEVIFFLKVEASLAAVSPTLLLSFLFPQLNSTQAT